MPPKPAPTILAAAAIAALIAAFDIVGTIRALMSPEGTGRVFGTFLRDGLLLLGAAMMLRRAKWAAWMVGVLFVLSLPRALFAASDLFAAVNVLAIPGLVLLLLPSSRAFLKADADAAPESTEG